MKKSKVGWESCQTYNLTQTYLSNRCDQAGRPERLIVAAGPHTALLIKTATQPDSFVDN